MAVLLNFRIFKRDFIIFICLPVKDVSFENKFPEPALPIDFQLRLYKHLCVLESETPKYYKVDTMRVGS